MVNPNRAAILVKAHKVLKRHFDVPPESDRPLLEELVFACLLENARHDVAHKTYLALVEKFFDWNEVRVSSIKELAAVFSPLPEPEETATRLKKILQSVFDKTYGFDLEPLTKMAVSKAVKELEPLQGATPFSIAHVLLTRLDGGTVPLDRGTLEALVIVGALTEADVAKEAFGPVLRAVPKNKRYEFASLLHFLGAELIASPYSTNLHKLLVEIAPDAKTRLPKRPTKAEEEAAKIRAEAKVKAQKAAIRLAERQAEKALEKPHVPKGKENKQPAEKPAEKAAEKGKDKKRPEPVKAGAKKKPDSDGKKKPR